MNKIFIDGSAGTTGLRIQERLGSRQDIELIRLPQELRKDIAARRDAINSADIVFLCLPDDAAIESAALVENDHTVVIDTSTAHRVAAGWVYGFPEIGGRREQIRTARKIANPGCHASGFIALVAPLMQTGVIRPDARIASFSLTGYSGGGKKMIADYEDTLGTVRTKGPAQSPCGPDGSDASSQDAAEQESSHARLLTGPRMYGLSQSHKHIPEMVKICALAQPPVFCPVVGDYYAGMEVTVQLSGHDVTASLREIAKIYESYYTDGLVHFVKDADEGGFLSAAAFAGRDDMQISVYGNDDRILLVSRFDNLGKGASGAAIQNMNLVMGAEETTGLVC